MKRIILKLSSIFIAVLLLCSMLVGCDLSGFFGSDEDENIPRLSTPVVTIRDDGYAFWTSDPLAMYYTYIIDDSWESVTDNNGVYLVLNQTIRVKAISGSDEYRDSLYSVEKKYTKGDPTPPTPPTPDGHTHVDANGDHVCDNCGKKAHVDADGNGQCDVCFENVVARLTFYAVNDLHGKFMDNGTQVGVDELTTYLKNQYKDPAREEIVLSSGDMWQGTVESSSNKGALMTEWMNDVGFVSMTLGNHEYDWGPNTLQPNSELARFPFLGINIKYNGKRPDYCKASTVVEKGGIKIGIIGAIGNCLSSISGEFSGGLSFATGNELTNLVKNEATRLRNEEKCDFIVYSVHDGSAKFNSYGINQATQDDFFVDSYTYYDTALSNGYVDLVFEGHTHKAYIAKDQYNVYHLQGKGENGSISCAEVNFNTVTNTWEVVPQIISSDVYAHPSIDDDPIVQELFSKYFKDYNPYEDIVGRNSSTKNSTTILNKVAELYYKRGIKEWSNYNIVLGGGFLNTRSPYNFYAGNVTYADLFSVLPFDNDIVLGKISGYYLKSQFLGGRANYYVYPTDVSKESILDNTTYYIVTDTYSAYYSWNHITEVKRISGGIYARDLLADYIREFGFNW